VLKERAHLYRPNNGVQWRSEPSRGSPFGSGDRHFVGQNPLPGAQIYYSLTKKADSVALKIVDISGKTVQELQAKSDPGLHRLTWTLTAGGKGGKKGGGKGFGGGGKGGGKGAKKQGTEIAPAAAGKGPPPQVGGKGPGFQGAGPGFGTPVLPGTYRVVLTVDGQEYTQTVRVEADPVQPAVLITPDDEDDDRRKR
jgi:hypothetical protein